MARTPRDSLVGLLLCLFAFGLGADEAPRIDNDQPESAQGDGSSWDADDTDFPAELARVMARYSSTSASHPEAKRLAVDALILATVVGDTKTANRLRSDLLERYPRSAEAAYVLNTFADTKKLREFLDTQFLTELPDERRALKAVNTIRLAFPRHQKELLDDQGFALRMARAAFLAGDRRTLNECRARLKDQAARIAGAACDELAPPVERFQELQSLLFDQECRSFDKEIRGFQKHLLTHMSLDERSSPEIRRPLARNHLQASELEEAVVQFEFLKDATDDPQLQFQFGLCLARLRRGDEARAVLRRLCADHPKSAWSNSAAELLELMEGIDVKLDQYAELMMDVIRAHRDLTPELIDLEVRWMYDDAEDATITIGMDLPRNLIEIVALREQTPVFAFLGRSDESTVYIRGEPVIYRLPKMPFLPDVELSDCLIDQTGDFHGKSRLGTGKSMNGLSVSFRDLLHNKQICSHVAMKLLMSGLIRHGYFPIDLCTVEGIRTASLVSAEIDEPRMLETSLEFDAEHHLRSAHQEFAQSRFEVRRFYLGARENRHLTAGTWPDLPTKTLADGDIGTLMRLMGAAMQLAFEVTGPAKIAADPAADSPQ